MQNHPHHTHYLRRLRRFIFYSIASFVVFLAVVMSIFRVVVAGADNWRTDLEQLGTYYLERQVYIEALDARLDGLVPVLILKNVRLMSVDEKNELFSFSEGKLELDIIDSIKTGNFIPYEFTIQGAKITVIRHRNKSFSFRGMELKTAEEVEKSATASNEFTDWLLRRSNLNVKDSSIIWIDQFREQPALRVDKVNIHLHNDTDRHQLKVSMELPETIGRSLEFSLDALGKISAKPSDWHGKIYLRGVGIHPARPATLPHFKNYRLLGGLADFELWGEWSQGQLERLSGDVTAYNLAIQHPDMKKTLALKLLSGLFNYQHSDAGWSLDINRFHLMNAQGSWPETDISFKQYHSDSSNSGQTQVQAKRFRLENISSLLLSAAVLSKQQTEMLENMKPSGDVENFQLVFSDNPDNKNIGLQALFSQLGFHPWKKIPGVRGFSGSVSGDPELMRVNLNSDYSVFDFPKMFRQPLKLSKLSGMFEIQHYEQGWQIFTESLLLKNEDAEIQSRVLLDIPENGSSLFMDLQVQFKNGNAAHASHYYPVNIISSGLLNWLDRGITGGRVVQGGAVFRGRLSDFPFKQEQGQFRVEFEVEDASIDYLEGWPAVSDGHFNAVFTDRGMHIKASTGRILDSRLSSTTIEIENFQHANLTIRGDVNGEVGDALRFLVESPIQPEAKPLLDSIHYHGSSRVELDLSIPLGTGVEKTQPLAVKGQVYLRDASLLLLDDQIDITEINGNIFFTENSQTATGIRARILGGEALIDIKTGDKADGLPVFIKTKGKIDSRHLVRKFGLPAWQQVDGMTDWEGVLSIRPQAKINTSLQVRSNLQGVEVNLPSPLGKHKDEIRDGLLDIQLSQGRARFYVHSKDYVSAAVVLNTETEHIRPLKAYVHLGEGEGHLPEAESLRISGSLSMFSLAPWTDALHQGKEEVTDSFVAIPLIFDMDNLQLAPVEAESESAAEEVKPRPQEKSVSKFDAALFPLIQGTIKNLSYDDVPIGRLEIKTSRLKIRKGIKLDSLSLQGEELNMQAKGEWVQWPNRDFSSMEVKLDSPDLGKMLSSLGFSAIFKGGETTLGGNLHWSDSPMGISLAGLDSNLKYTVKDGSIVSVEPGAGRLLGLFSLAALPRRLVLDFSDAFGDGLSFDSIEGELDIHDGSAFMDNNLMKSPLAHISVSGRTGLVNRDFDQLITVYPRGGDALTVVAGGMLFGPQIGAVILLAQKILGNELKDATAIKYKVSGSWEEPVITRLNQPKQDEGISLDDDDF